MKASLLDQLDRLVHERPSKLLYSFLDLNGETIESYTYASFQHRTKAIAAHLRKGLVSRPGSGSCLLILQGLR